MKIKYKTRKLERNLTDDRKLFKVYGLLAKKIKQRIKELRNAENLETIGKLPQLRLHPYIGQRKGEWSINIKDNWRIIFSIENEPIPILDDGSVDLSKITIIKINSIEDPH